MSGNEFELIETGASRYYIFDTVTGRYIEYSENAPSPYLGEAGELVYLGPKSYYIKNNQNYSHTVLLKEKEKSIADLLKLQNEFSQRIHQCRQRKDDIVLTLMSEIENSSSTSINVQTLALTPTPTPILIAHHEYVEDATFPSNQGGTCGYVAACLVLNYWNKTYPNADVIDNVFLNGSGNLLTSGYTLQDKLLSYGYPTATTGLTIRNVLYTYCTEYGIGANISYSLSFLNVLGSLQNNRPVILFGNVVGEGDHAVTAYGYTTDTY